ncbi:uncharacterized protein LOC131976281 [Centropristis striata]|uniref:uncharacterized protein LOC131976281 n=1 Tax=Centropristis striata TaxID=184440 RepID=UPI0027DEE13F|nr:uncharacterized protein LOC131976281 [Centropristis striata]
MFRLNPDCWLWSPSPPPCLHPPHSGSFASAEMNHQEEEEEEEEEAGEHPAACCYTTGCDDIISQDPRWAPADPPLHSGVPSSSGPAGRGPGAPQQPETVLGGAGGAVWQVAGGGRCWEGSGMNPQGCVCVYGQREPEGLGPCWPGSPYVYYGGESGFLLSKRNKNDKKLTEIKCSISGSRSVSLRLQNLFSREQNKSDSVSTTYSEKQPKM